MRDPFGHLLCTFGVPLVTIGLLTETNKNPSVHIYLLHTFLFPIWLIPLALISFGRLLVFVAIFPRPTLKLITRTARAKKKLDWMNCKKENKHISDVLAYCTCSVLYGRTHYFIASQVNCVVMTPGPQNDRQKVGKGENKSDSHTPSIICDIGVGLCGLCGFCISGLS